jgi:hypothetical protein
MTLNINTVLVISGNMEFLDKYTTLVQNAAFKSYKPHILIQHLRKIRLIFFYLSNFCTLTTNICSLIRKHLRFHPWVE